MKNISLSAIAATCLLLQLSVSCKKHSAAPSTPPPAPSLSTVTTLSGGGIPNTAGTTVQGGYTNGIDSIARWQSPTGIAIDVHGNMFVADKLNFRIRELSGNMVSSFAGNGAESVGELITNGPAATADFNEPAGVAVDANGNVYVADLQNYVIRKISAGTVSTFAGGEFGYVNGAGSVAEFSFPEYLAVDAQNNLYVSEQAHIRKITPAGIVSTFAGAGSLADTGNYKDGQDTGARFSNPTGLAFDSQGNLYVADNTERRIRKITPGGLVSTLAGSGVAGFADGPANTAQFTSPEGLAVDSQGNIYVADFSCIRKVTPDGTVSTIAGTHFQGWKDGPGSSAQFYAPAGMVFDAQGNLYVADPGNQRIRKITFN